MTRSQANPKPTASSATCILQKHPEPKSVRLPARYIGVSFERRKLQQPQMYRGLRELNVTLRFCPKGSKYIDTTYFGP